MYFLHLIICQNNNNSIVFWKNKYLHMHIKVFKIFELNTFILCEVKGSRQKFLEVLRHTAAQREWLPSIKIYLKNGSSYLSISFPISKLYGSVRDALRLRLLHYFPSGDRKLRSILTFWHPSSRWSWNEVSGHYLRLQ